MVIPAPYMRIGNAAHSTSAAISRLTCSCCDKRCAILPQGFGVHHALNPDPYRGGFGNDGTAYAADVADLISAATPGRVAGFFHETIQGVGGAVPLADGYLPAVYEVSLHRAIHTA